jgi:hypothetical protein
MRKITKIKIKIFAGFIFAILMNFIIFFIINFLVFSLKMLIIMQLFNLEVVHHAHGDQ